MDTLRGPFGDYTGADAYDAAEDEIGHEAPPQPVGQDERRMQVRAYNHWASLLGSRAFPLITDLAPGAMPDFDPYAVLLDVSESIENPRVRFVGSAIAAESECEGAAVQSLAEVPGRSLLSRITDHYMQILANQAPIGFEAEFVSQRGRTVLYRGILLPFSGGPDSDAIDYIYGVINWKELADQQTTDALMEEIDRALQPRPAQGRSFSEEPLTAWADGPMDLPRADHGDILDLAFRGGKGDAFDWADPVPHDGAAARGLSDLLASARELAEVAHGSEERSRKALYAAIGRAHEFALAAADQPEEFAELVADAGLAVQQRAPLIPLVKLIFGHAYDKTRLTEYATVISHAQRLGLAAGALADFLVAAPGGLKGVVQLERRLRRQDAGQNAVSRPSPNERVVRKLRALPTRALDEIEPAGEEFTLLVARRVPGGGVRLIGEVGGDPALVERAARQLLR